MRKFNVGVILFWIFAISVSCVSSDIPQTPHGPPTSPLPPPHAVSPLPPPAIVRGVTVRGFLPLMRGKSDPDLVGCAKSPETETMAWIFENAEWQRRQNAHCHPQLMLAAQHKADEMLRLHYFDHTSPSGVGANRNVRNTGYTLPPWYWEDGNNVESIGLNYATPEAMFAAWLSGIFHRPHVAGESDFFREQGCYGVGYARGEADAGIYYVLITAPCN